MHIHTHKTVSDWKVVRQKPMDKYTNTCCCVLRSAIMKRMSVWGGRVF